MIVQRHVELISVTIVYQIIIAKRYATILSVSTSYHECAMIEVNIRTHIPIALVSLLELLHIIDNEALLLFRTIAEERVLPLIFIADCISHEENKGLGWYQKFLQINFYYRFRSIVVDFEIYRSIEGISAILGVGVELKILKNQRQVCSSIVG